MVITSPPENSWMAFTHVLFSINYTSIENNFTLSNFKVPMK